MLGYYFLDLFFARAFCGRNQEGALDFFVKRLVKKSPLFFAFSFWYIPGIAIKVR